MRFRVLLAIVALILGVVPVVGSEPATANDRTTDCGPVPTGYNVIESDAKRIIGTLQPDFICAGPSANFINAKGGDDIVHGGAGNDVIKGGSGNDQLRGGKGKDRISGAKGDDQLFGQQGHDKLIGNAGDDRLIGGGGRDQLTGSKGNDQLVGGGGSDRLLGGTGDDLLVGSSGVDHADAADGTDTCRTVETYLSCEQGIFPSAPSGSCSADEPVPESVFNDRDREVMTSMSLDGDPDARWSPAVIFPDETTTYMRHKAGFADGEPLLHDWERLTVDGVPATQPIALYDDGTHGDQIAGDQLYTRACLGFQGEDFDGLPGELAVATGYPELLVVNPALRESLSVDQLSETLRATNGGFFVELGENHGIAEGNIHNRIWETFDAGQCRACDEVYAHTGDAFDLLVFQTRESDGGPGYTRVRDQIEGIGLETIVKNGYEKESKRWPNLDGIVAAPSIVLSGITHEVGHWVGVEAPEFPSKRHSWTPGFDGHITSNATISGPLSGPFWDPARGWPFPTVSPEGGELILVEAADGSFELQPDNLERERFDDLLLYMLGVLPPENATEVDYLLVDPKPQNCTTQDTYLECPIGTAVLAERIIEFTTNDFIDTFGPRSPAAQVGPINIGVLNITDRPHTEAEMIALTLLWTEWATATEWDGTGALATSPFLFATSGHGSVDIDGSGYVRNRDN